MSEWEGGGGGGYLFTEGNSVEWTPVVSYSLVPEHPFLPDLQQQACVQVRHLARREGVRLTIISQQPAWSTLIGRGMSRLGSHWSRASMC